MTEEELAASAAAHAKRTTISHDEFLRRVKTNPGYRYQSTEWYAALADLEAIKHLAPPTLAGPDLSAVRNLVIFATVTDSGVQQACRLGRPWRICFTSDPAYAVSEAQIKAARTASMGPYAWSGPGIDPQITIGFVHRHGLAGWYGEGETQDGFDAAVNASVKPLGLIGNLSALRDDQRAQVASGEVLFNYEAYRNIVAQRNADYESYVRNTGPYKGMGGYSVAVYASATENAVYTPVSWYLDRGYFVKGRDSIYTEGFLPADWEVLR